MHIYVRLVTGLVIELDVDEEQSIGSIKQQLIDRQLAAVEDPLVLGNQQLDEENTVADCQLQDQRMLVVRHYPEVEPPAPRDVAEELLEEGPSWNLDFNLKVVMLTGAVKQRRARAHQTVGRRSAEGHG